MRRTLGTADRRQRYVTLAASGAALVERVAAARAARFKASLATVPAPLAARLSAVLAEVVAALDNDRRPP